MRIEVKEEIIKILDNYFKKVFSNENNFEILSNLNKSIAEAKILNFETSLVLSWFIIEKYINIYWEKFINSDQENINKKRNESLKDHRTYVIAVKLNILQFNDFISLEDFNSLNEIRKIRNEIVHVNKNNKCTFSDCCLAFELIKKFIKDDMQINLNINQSYSLSGI